MKSCRNPAAPGALGMQVRSGNFFLKSTGVGRPAVAKAASAFNLKVKLGCFVYPPSVQGENLFLVRRKLGITPDIYAKASRLGHKIWLVRCMLSVELVNG